MFFVRLQLTEKVLAKCGISKNFSSRKTKRSECFFNTANLQKNAELKSMSGLFFLLFNFALSPAFCQYNVICCRFYLLLIFRLLNPFFNGSYLFVLLSKIYEKVNVLSVKFSIFLFLKSNFKVSSIILYFPTASQAP